MVDQSTEPEKQYIGVTRTRKRVRALPVFLALMVPVALFLYMNFHTAVVEGVSMLPTFKTGQKVLVSKAYWLVGPIKKHDILVVHDKNITGYMIKRVFALEGEEVPWQYAPEGFRLADGTYKVPEGQIYLMGDNRGYSEDCRKIGAVPLEKVVGKVIIL